MEKFTQTPKGTRVPLLDLRGKPYLLGAYRLIWLNEEYKFFDIKTEFLLITDDQAVCKATVTLYDENRNIVKSAQATKRETKKDFPDFTEKSESSSCFRALAMLGMGTQFATVELDEGHRIVDSPVEPGAKSTKQSTLPSLSSEAIASGVAITALQLPLAEAKKTSSFRKPKPAQVVEEDKVEGWE